MNIDDVKKVIDYDPITGIFTWKEYRNQLATPGKVAGCVNSKGYLEITILGKRVKAHRLAWFYVYKEWPENHIDHINRIKTDNSINNLRIASISQNLANKALTKTNTSGLKGAFYNKRMKKWHSSYSFNNKRYHLGYFNSAEDAHKSYVKKMNELYGDFFFVG